MDGLSATKMPLLMKMSRSCTPWSCVLEGETASMASEVIISFGGVQLILTGILKHVKGFGKMGATNVD